MIHLSNQGGQIVTISVTLMLFAVFVHLIVTGQPIPDNLTEIIAALVAFWFGARSVDVAPPRSVDDDNPIPF